MYLLSSRGSFPRGMYAPLPYGGGILEDGGGVRLTSLSYVDPYTLPFPYSLSPVTLLLLNGGGPRES